MFRKPNPPTPPAVAEDEITDDLLANVPELEGGDEVTSDAGAFAGFVQEKKDGALPFTLVDEDRAATANLVPPVPPAPEAPPRRPRKAASSPPVITPTPFPLGDSTQAPPAPPAFAPEVDPAALDMDVRGLVDQTRSLMASAFQDELTRVESNVGTLLDQMQSRLAQAELELAAVRAEHEKVKVDTERKAEALRDLKRALETV